MSRPLTVSSPSSSTLEGEHRQKRGGKPDWGPLWIYWTEAICRVGGQPIEGAESQSAITSYYNTYYTYGIHGMGDYHIGLHTGEQLCFGRSLVTTSVAPLP